MIRGTVVVLIVLSVSAAQCALAAELASLAEVVQRGPGAADCATFAKFYKERPDDEYMLLTTWITGYLSGLNVMTRYNGHDMKNLKSFNVDGAVNRIKVFCDQHPLLYFGEQLDAMWNELPSIKDTAH